MATGSRTSRGRKAGPTQPGDHTAGELMARARWKALPPFVVLAGTATFLRKSVERRFIEELFGEQPLPSIHRVNASLGLDGLLAQVLDELRTLSILSSERLVIVESADAFVAEHRNDLEPFVEEGFSGGHLVLHLEKKPATNTRFSKAVRQHGWLVECQQPFDRPPPWQTGAPPWENPLTAWIVSWAKSKELRIDPKTAYGLQERVGSDLTALDESLEKIRTYLGDRGPVVTREAVLAITGETREDSLFDLVEAFIARDRLRAISMAERLLRSGYHPPKSGPVYDASSIAIMFIGALISRVKPLRRAHAMRARGAGPERWIEERLTSKPFMERFQRELQAMPPARIRRTFESLTRLDRSIKTGGDPALGLWLVLAGI